MILSKKTKYAIHALVILAKEYGKGPVLIKEISESGHIPQKFLENILLELKNTGILKSRKGKGGGYYLLKKPEEVNLASIIRLFDGAIGMIPCVTYLYYEKCEECQDENSCGVRAIFKDVRDVTVDLLKKATMAGIIQRERELNKKRK